MLTAHGPEGHVIRYHVRNLPRGLHGHHEDVAGATVFRGQGRWRDFGRAHGGMPLHVLRENTDAPPSKHLLIQISARIVDNLKQFHTK